MYQGRTKVFEELNKEVAKLPSRVRDDMLIIRGNAETAAGRNLQKEARARLTPKQIALAEGAQFVSDWVWDRSGDIIGGKKQEFGYQHGMWEFEGPKGKLKGGVSDASFQKEKHWRYAADAIAAGGKKPIENNIYENLRMELVKVEQLRAIGELRDSIVDYGGSRLARKRNTVRRKDVGPKKPWDVIGVEGGQQEKVLEEYVFERDTAKFINTLLVPNFWSQTFRRRGVKAIGHASQIVRLIVRAGFHARTILESAVADQGLLSLANPAKWPKFIRQATPLPISRRERATAVARAYAEVGGFSTFSAQQQAVKMLEKISVVAYLPQNAAVQKTGKAITALPRVWRSWSKFIMQKYIPRVQYYAFRDRYTGHVEKHGEAPSRAQQLDWVKESQNIYGLMNEQSLGFSKSATSWLRVGAAMPGFALGNFRTKFKALTQLEGGHRSRYNMLYSVMFTGLMASITQKFLTGKWKPFPTTQEELLDIGKIVTNLKDANGNPLVIDMGTSSHDYLLELNAIMKRRDADGLVGETVSVGVAVGEAWMKRMAGMTAAPADVAADLLQVMQGKALFDYKGNRIWTINDKTLQKAAKIFWHETNNFEPFGVSAFRRLSKFESLTALEKILWSVGGPRISLTEKERVNRLVSRKAWSLREDLRQLHADLIRLDNPREAIKNHNQLVEDVYGDKDVARRMKERTKIGLGIEKKELLIDLRRLMLTKFDQFTSPGLLPGQVTRSKQWFKNFGIESKADYERLWKAWVREHPTAKLATFGFRRRRLDDRFAQPDVR